jgi:hypothetical protein
MQPSKEGAILMSFDLDRDDEPLSEAMHLHRRHISEKQLHTYEGYMAEIFTAFGLDLDTPATRHNAISAPCLIQPKAMRAIPNCSRRSRPNVGVGRTVVWARWWMNCS